MRAVAAGLAAVVPLIALAAVPAPAGEIAKKVVLSVDEVDLVVEYPGEGDKRWAEVVAAHAEAGLPALEKAAGFVCPVRSFKISYAADAAATGGFEAAWKGGGAVAARKKASRGGAHGHALLWALAHAWSEKVTEDPWLREALAHLYVWGALRNAPLIYDARTYRDELVQEAAKSDEIPLARWGAPGGAADAEHAVARPRSARAALFLACVERRVGERALARVSENLSAREPGGLAELVAAVAQIAQKPVDDLFWGWALEIEDPEAQKPVLGTKSIHDDDDDSLLNFEEAELGTDARLNDTDGDGLLDGEEVFDAGTDPKAKDAPRTPIQLDGDVKEWMRAKKFAIQDRKGDQKKAVNGADLLKVQLCADARFLYLALEADSFANPQVKYSVAFDNDGDHVADYIFGFRGDRHRWIGDTHGVADLSWCEWKNHRGIVIRTKDATAETRIPLVAIGTPRKTEVLVYSEVAKEGLLDSCLRTPVDLDKFRH